MPALIHKLQTDGPTLRHCMFCGIGHNHLFDNCPTLNDSQFLNSFVIRVGSAYQRTLNDAVRRQKEARGIAENGNDQSGKRQPLLSHIRQLLQTPELPPEPEPAPAHPDFLSADFVPGQPPPTPKAPHFP
jgi:hypothetical protein